MRLLNKNICLTNRLCLLITIGALFSTLVIASVWPDKVEEIKETPPNNEEQMWIPTEEDIQYQDSMYQIIQQTQNDVDTIKVQVQMIIERLDYEDGTYDSIRYVKDGKIDKRRN
tara:strand:- start:127 stop:468 length:342 start_codon:yes stop_codon:yes gene_type:complete